MGGRSACFKVTQGGQLYVSRFGSGVDLVGKTNRPTGRGHYLFTGHPRVQRGDYELMGALLRLHDAQVGNDPYRTGARQAQAFTRVAAFAMAD